MDCQNRHLCPCGSGETFAACCQPIITGESAAEPAERLMRARYSAYVDGQVAFILETTHPDHRQDFDAEGIKAWAENSEWEGLEIIRTHRGGKNDDQGQVEFIAKNREDGKGCAHHELSGFDKIDGTWYFTPAIRVLPAGHENADDETP